MIIASERGEVGLAAGIALLRDGASAMDAAEAAVRVAEANEADHYVGVGGLPNLLGVVELDASIMDGATRRAGAVAGVTGFPHPISIARAVCDRLPQHLLLVGAGAERFADEVGIPRGQTLTDEARQLWLDGLGQDGLADAAERHGPGEVAYRRQVIERLAAIGPPPGPWGTVNVIALDTAGNLATAVSTSGYPWKYPGRVGDSAVIGRGQLLRQPARRAPPAPAGASSRSVPAPPARCCSPCRPGRGPLEACAAALEQTLDLPDEYRAPLSALCLTPDGSHGGASTRAGATYAVMTAEDESYRIEKRRQI